MFNYKKIISLLMAVTILVSSGGVAISKHICENEILDVSIFGEADHCIQKDSASTHDHDQMNMTHEGDCEKNCCKDETDLVKVDLPQINSIDEIVPDFSLSLLYSYVLIENYFLNASESQVPVNNYLFEPPLITQDVHILIQSLLL